MENTPAIGIDLGTTNTVAAFYNGTHAEIIQNREGKRFTPSVVFYGDLSNAVIGADIEASFKCIRNFVYDMKRLIGRNYDDAYVQSFITRQNQLKRGLIIGKDPSSGLPCVKLENPNKQAACKTVTPEDVALEILKSIKEDAKVRLGADIKEAVISVPAYFSYAQRAATKRAAEKAGFEVMRLIAEPVAAAIYYTQKHTTEDIEVLVVDLGGGTLDVCLILCGKSKFEVKSVEGDMFLGGRDFDDVIFDHLKKELDRKCKGNIDYGSKSGERLLHRLREISGKFKHTLTTNKSYTLPVYTGSDEHELHLTRSKFEELSDHLFHRVISRIEKCLKSCNRKPEDIDKVVLAGGSTRIPKLKQMLTEYFNGKEPYTDLNPDEAVAMGASIHAALLKKNVEHLEVYRLKDVAPHSLGILAKYNLMVSFIPKGTPLPISVKQIMETCENNQQSVIFSIYEGERKHCLRNKKLGQFVIDKLPRGKAGQVEFEVTFFLDDSGVLKVSAVERQTKNCNQLEIHMDDLTVCESMAITSVETESLIDDLDRQFEELCRLRLKTDTYCNGLLYDIEEPHLKGNKHEIIKRVSKFKNFSDTCQDFHAASVEFERLQQDINALVNPQ